MAISDLLSGCIVSYFAMTEILEPKQTAGLKCHIPVFVQLACVASTIFGHLAVGVDRYVAVVKPTMKFLDLRKAVFVVIGTWIVSVLYSLRLLAQFSNGGNNTKTFCNLFVEEKEDASVYRSVDFVVLFLIPLSALSCMYQHIGTKLWSKRSKVTPIVRRKRKVVKFLALSMCLFFLGWSPFYILDLVGDSLKGTELPHQTLNENGTYVVLRFCFILMALSNNVITPFIYIIYFPSIRAETKVAIWGVFRGVTFPSEREKPRSIRTNTLWTTSHMRRSTFSSTRRPSTPPGAMKSPIKEFWPIRRQL